MRSGRLGADKQLAALSSQLSGRPLEAALSSQLSAPRENREAALVPAVSSSGNHDQCCFSVSLRAVSCYQELPHCTNPVVHCRPCSTSTRPTRHRSGGRSKKGCGG